MRRLLAFLLLLCLAVPAAAEDGMKFAVRNGSREEPRIAITIDDCYDRDHVREAFELAQQYGIAITFFPLGDQILEQDAELWQAIAASNCEIGNHTYHHHKLGTLPGLTIITHVMKTQECLDRVLGYHYTIRSLRPPFGNIEDANGDTRMATRYIKRAGYEHIVLWDVSQTDPDKAIKKVKNGSILLYHTRARDIRCLEKLIPMLQEKGFEMVTVTELLGFEPIETSEELYVFNKNDY